MFVSVTVNGEPTSVEVGEFDTLLGMLRDRLGLTGAKDACLQGECGSCTVLLDGLVVCACLVLAADADGATVTTVEGLGATPVARALVDAGAVQCGFCTPGIVVAASQLPADATVDDVREGLSGNLCRCTGYGAIVRAVADAPQQEVGP